MQLNLEYLALFGHANRMTLSRSKSKPMQILRLISAPVNY